LKDGSTDLFIISAGIVLLLLASPLFAFYQLFPAISSQVGPHQISSWVALGLGFIGFIMIIYGAARHDI
jgi:uncharacterized membrane protein YidH (DUF202 family)